MSDTDNTQQDDTQAKPPQLVSIELRVLGALMEKQLTTPDQYPLTLNSLMSACNQKSSRDPVSNYNQGEIVRALQELQHQGFVSKEYGSRAEKFSQQFMKHLELGRKHQAVLCVMMLRGPQTLSELITRTQRMTHFTDKDDLQHTLDRLCNRDIPFAIRLGQRPGQRGERFTHLFSGMPSQAVQGSSVQTFSAERPSQVNEASPSDRQGADRQGPAAIAAKHSADHDVQALQAELDSVNVQLRQIKQQLERLYELTGHELGQK